MFVIIVSLILMAVGGWFMYASHHDIASPGYIGSAGIAVFIIGVAGFVVFLIGFVALLVMLLLLL